MADSTDLPAAQAIDPFTLLPNELVLAIASYLHDEAIQKVLATSRGLLNHHFLEPILALASVSQRLRSVVVAEPAFWCHVIVTEPDTRTDAISTILERSKEYPLDIIWIARLSSLQQRNIELFEELSKQSHRWRALRLVGSTTTCLSSMIEDISGIYTPMLAEFHVTDLEGWTTIRRITEMTWPALKSLRITTYPFLSIKVDLSTITRMELALSDHGRLSFQDVKAAANALTALEYLALDSTFAVASWDEDDTDSANWDSLSTLVLKDKKFYLWRYLTFMNCPKLRTLVLLDVGRFDFPKERMQRISSNYPEVEALDLVEVRFQRGYTDPWSLPEAFSKLSRLSLSYERCESTATKDEVARDFDNLFWPNSLFEGAWPDLQTLELGPMHVQNRLNDIASFVERRQDEGHPLVVVGIPKDEPEMEAALKGKVTLYTCSVSTLSQYNTTLSRV